MKKWIALLTCVTLALTGLCALAEEARFSPTAPVSGTMPGGDILIGSSAEGTLVGVEAEGPIEATKAILETWMPTDVTSDTMESGEYLRIMMAVSKGGRGFTLAMVPGAPDTPEDAVCVAVLAADGYAGTVTVRQLPDIGYYYIDSATQSASALVEAIALDGVTCTPEGVDASPQFASADLGDEEVPFELRLLCVPADDDQARKPLYHRGVLVAADGNVYLPGAAMMNTNTGVYSLLFNLPASMPLEGLVYMVDGQVLALPVGTA